jgi:hypothetical protein
MTHVQAELHRPMCRSHIHIECVTFNAGVHAEQGSCAPISGTQSLFYFTAPAMHVDPMASTCHGPLCFTLTCSCFRQSEQSAGTYTAFWTMSVEALAIGNHLAPSVGLLVRPPMHVSCCQLACALQTGAAHCLPWQCVGDQRIRCANGGCIRVARGLSGLTSARHVNLPSSGSCVWLLCSTIVLALAVHDLRI